MRALVLSLVLLLASTTPLRAAGRDLAQSVARSDTIVVARCTAARSYWDDTAHVIVTDTTLAVDRTIKGNRSATITVRTLGGRVGSTGMGTSHATRFIPGATVVALLRQSRFGPYFVVASSQSSFFSVSADRVAIGTRTMDLQAFTDWLQSTAP